MDLDAALDRLARDPAADADLVELGLHLAADAYPSLDINAYLGRVAALAERLRPRLAGTARGDAEALCALLFDEEGLRGNAADYYDPRNSYLNEVLDRRLGLPITLSVLAVGVARRCGLAAAGVGLPGHFVAAVFPGRTGDEVVWFDLFHGGRLLTPADCAELAARATGRAVPPGELDLGPTPPGLVVARMLTNLKGAYLGRDDYAGAAAVLGRLARLRPAEPGHRRDLGACLLRSGRPGRAADELTAYLEVLPDADDADAVRALLARARREVARWN